MAKLTKKEKEKIHMQTLQMLGGHSRGATWVGLRPSVVEDKRPTKNKKLRRTESRNLCRNYSY